MKFLAEEFPSWVPRYDRLYARKHAPEDYRKQVAGMVTLLQNYGLKARERAEVGSTLSDGEEQVGFAW